MKNSGRGGMQSAGTHYAIYCPKCGKPAYRVNNHNGFLEYLHFSKKGTVRHVNKESPPAAKLKGDNTSPSMIISQMEE